MLTFSEVITARHVPTLCRLVLVVAIIATPVPTFAQGTSAPPTDLRRYPLPTYEEDWRALQGSARTDIWDPVKFVPLSADGTTSLSFGGEARVTYERFGNPNFGLTPPWGVCGRRVSRPRLRPSECDHHSEACKEARMRRVCKNGRQLGSPAHVSRVRPDAVLR
jgi:hypothetical protein